MVKNEGTEQRRSNDHMDGHISFVKGVNYWKWDMTRDRSLSSRSNTMANGWGKLPFPSIDACLVYPLNTGPPSALNNALFFYDNQYCEYDFVKDTAGDGPFPISHRFPGLPFDRIDACLVYPPGVGPDSAVNQAYFFNGPNYCSWDLISNTISSDVEPIANRWKGLPCDRIDAIVVYYPDCPSYALYHACIFRNDCYANWDLQTDSHVVYRRIKDAYGNFCIV